MARFLKPRVVAHLILAHLCLSGWMLACRLPNAVAARGLFSGECPPTAIGLPLPVYTSVCSITAIEQWYPLNGVLNLLPWLTGYVLILVGFAATARLIARNQSA